MRGLLSGLVTYIDIPFLLMSMKVSPLVPGVVRCSRMAERTIALGATYPPSHAVPGWYGPLTCHICCTRVLINGATGTSTDTDPEGSFSCGTMLARARVTSRRNCLTTVQ